jgi:hypothetical protein
VERLVVPAAPSAGSSAAASAANLHCGSLASFVLRVAMMVVLGPLSSPLSREERGGEGGSEGGKHTRVTSIRPSNEKPPSLSLSARQPSVGRSLNLSC